VWGWGNNSSCTLGNGTDISSDYPVKVVNLVNIISIDQSYGAEVALDVSGNVWFWGNLFIYFGPPNIDTNVVTPIKLTQIENPKTISMDGIYIYELYPI
jgi:alpha-tubulin suppressor-like RCC1 family protein